ncbi:MAG: hypothetical protein DI601_08090 [Azospirillum brasilense]|nr:MAG: hypothetical protein DI601_08090 [Azospirillum brasilense]
MISFVLRDQTAALQQLRQAFYGAGQLLPVDLPDRLLERRERILDLAAALLALADAMDAPAAELAPEPLDDDSEAEASAQPVTLCPDCAPSRRAYGRRAA